MRYEISLDGCDASTTFTMELNKEELDLLKKVAELSNEHSFDGCMPTMTVEATND